MRFLFIILVMACGAAQGQMYARVDKITGHTTYTNIPPPGEEVVDPTPMRRATREFVPAKPRSTIAELNKSPVTPTEFPRVAKNVQRDRDEDRRHILTTELKREMAALVDVQTSKGDTETVNRHKTNIASLQREIKNIK